MMTKSLHIIMTVTPLERDFLFSLKNWLRMVEIDLGRFGMIDFGWVQWLLVVFVVFSFMHDWK